MELNFDFEVMKNELEEAGAGNKNPAIFKFEDNMEFDFRILPWFHDGELQKNLFVNYTAHYDVGSQTVLCNKTDNYHGGGLKDCPICFTRMKLYVEKDPDLVPLAKKLGSSDRAAFQGVVKGEEDKGVRIFTLAKSSALEILTLLANDPDIYKPNEEGSYISCTTFVEAGKKFHTKKFNVKTGKKAGTFQVPAVFPTALQELYDSALAKGKSDTEAFLDAVREFGHDLKDVLCPDSKYLEPKKIEGIVAGTPAGKAVLPLLEPGDPLYNTRQLAAPPADSPADGDPLDTMSEEELASLADELDSVQEELPI